MDEGASAKVQHVRIELQTPRKTVWDMVAKPQGEDEEFGAAAVSKEEGTNLPNSCATEFSRVVLKLFRYASNWSTRVFTVTAVTRPGEPVETDMTRGKERKCQLWKLRITTDLPELRYHWQLARK